mmetsp:Transcript_125584/g.313818  ORF Transcript_125584/g.313818 Transcript_125584/m.313818 type:complete len:186 (+) Transcript_125584:12-569(+)
MSKLALACVLWCCLHFLDVVDAELATRVQLRSPLPFANATRLSRLRRARTRLSLSLLDLGSGVTAVARQPGFDEGTKEALESARTRLSSLVEQEQRLLSEFDEESLSTDSLYREAQNEVESAKYDFRLKQIVCAALTSCKACITSQVCGWCSVESRCLPGDSYGLLADTPETCPAYHFENCDLAR